MIPTPETGTLWHVRYHLVDEATGAPDPDATVTVATTRPETILGDTAVAVHPDDPRYAALVGRRVRIPFVERDVPVIADPVVDPAFGTGAVKITPAHDHDDNETGRRHGLATPTILDDAAHVANTGTAYDGLERYAARTRILADLAARGDLEGERPHEMVIGRCQRSTDVVEPRLKTQWFVRTAPLAEAALAATRSGTTRILPERFEKTWEHWLVNIRDWNVSRQLWWGHRIPAWYCPDGHATVAAEVDGPAACEVCAKPAGALTQDPDIFDTWFSSGLWPFSTLGWPDETADVARFYPGAVMETAYDIIFFWVARMMMLGIELMGEVPFRRRLPLGPDPGPVRPEDVQDEGEHRRPPGDDRRGRRGRAALRRSSTGRRPATTSGSLPRRWTTPATSATSSGTPRDTCWVPARRRSRRTRRRQAPDPALLGPAERWVLSRASDTVAAVDRAMADYGFGEVTRLLYEAIWSEYCDWGIELAKVRLADDELPARGARGHLVGAGRGAGHVPPAPAPGHAVHHRAPVAGPASPRDRPGAADRRPVAQGG